jgi:hypothetical protein
LDFVKNNLIIMNIHPVINTIEEIIFLLICAIGIYVFSIFSLMAWGQMDYVDIPEFALICTAIVEIYLIIAKPYISIRRK